MAQNTSGKSTFGTAVAIRKLREAGWSDARIREAAQSVIDNRQTDIPYKREFQAGDFMLHNFLFAGALMIPAIFLFIMGLVAREFLYIWACGVIVIAMIARIPDHIVYRHAYIDSTYDGTNLALKQWDTVVLAYVIPLFFATQIFQWFIANIAFILGTLMCYVINPLVLIILPGVIIPMIGATYVVRLFDRYH